MWKITGSNNIFIILFGNSINADGQITRIDRILKKYSLFLLFYYQYSEVLFVLALSFSYHKLILFFPFSSIFFFFSVFAFFRLFLDTLFFRCICFFSPCLPFFRLFINALFSAVFAFSFFLYYAFFSVFWSLRHCYLDTASLLFSCNKFADTRKSRAPSVTSNKISRQPLHLIQKESTCKSSRYFDFWFLYAEFGHSSCDYFLVTFGLFKLCVNIYSSSGWCLFGWM